MHASGFAQTLVTAIDVPDMGPAKRAPRGRRCDLCRRWEERYRYPGRRRHDSMDARDDVRWSKPAGSTELRRSGGRRLTGQAGTIPRHAGACGRVPGRRLGVHPLASRWGRSRLRRSRCSFEQQGTTRLPQTAMPARPCRWTVGSPFRTRFQTWSLSDLGPGEAKGRIETAAFDADVGYPALPSPLQLPFLGTHAGELRVIGQIES